MGTDVYASAKLTISEEKAAEPAFARTVSQLLQVPAVAHELDDSGTPLDMAWEALMEAFGTQDGEIERADNQIVFFASGWGRPYGVDDVLDILADAGFTGEVTCEDSCDDRWRHRLTADGTVLTENGFTVYCGTPITGVWIVQMQCTDDSDPDHVTVVGAEDDAQAILAGWARTDARALIADGVLPASRIDLDADDAALLDRWSEVGGVKWEVYQPR